MLARTSITRIELTSFVRADVVPQLSDAPAVLEGVDVPDSVSRSVLIPNERGLDNALALREHFDEIGVFVSASETHDRKNVNRSCDESRAGIEALVPRALQDGSRSRPSSRRRSAVRTRAASKPTGSSPSCVASSTRAPARSASVTPPAWRAHEHVAGLQVVHATIFCAAFSVNSAQPAGRRSAAAAPAT